MDEQRHETFAVEVGGCELFGEARREFLDNKNDYNIVVVSFGYRRVGDVGMPMAGSCRVFGAGDVLPLEKLIRELIFVGGSLSDRPSLLKEYSNAHFMGGVSFQESWLLVDGR